MSGPSVKIIADSTYEGGPRLTTMEVCLWRPVLAEFNTHRVFSRNSASSRAIPLEKQLVRVRDDTAYPLVFPKEQKGMSGDETLDQHREYYAGGIWREAMEAASDCAERLGELGVHKSVANRLLEPFMWHTICVTSTAWENFFRQRVSEKAQPEIREPARMMKQMMEAHLADSKPQVLKAGEWHLPYIANEDWADLAEHTELGKSMYPEMVKISAARCAQLSYLTQPVVDAAGHIMDPGGKRDVVKDLNRYDMLTKREGNEVDDPIHWSPLEQVATPWPENRQEGSLWIDSPHEDATTRVPLEHLPRVGNLLAWRSLRTTVEAERGAVTFA